MHQIKTSIRETLPSELPRVTPRGEATRPMNEQELLNLGLVPLGNDLYSCICQEERDPETLEWQPKDGQQLPGTVVTEGLLKDRHDRLPADLREKVMRASVIRSKDGNADDLVSAILIDVAGEAERLVGLVDGRPLIDASNPETMVAEAKRQVKIPDSGFARESVKMADVAIGDVVETENIVPHQWAGEPRR